LLEDIENTPIVRQRNSVLDASRYIFVDANQMEDAAFPRLPVRAGPEDGIEVKFTSGIEADSILGTEKIAEMQAGMLRCAGHEHDWMRGPANAQ
jgi:hypothetical protein